MSKVAARCARCGRPVEPGEHLCAQCREEAPVQVLGTEPRPEPLETELDQRRRRWPPGMVRPSPVQYHATVMVTVALVLVGLALFAFLNHRGVGPFSASLLRSDQRGAGSVALTFFVRNDGSRAGRSTCRITAVNDARLPLGTDTVLTHPIQPGATVRLSHTLQGLASPPARLLIHCI